MALLGFKAQFVPKITSGFKRHTIRDERSRPFKVGERLHLYTGLRRKGAQLLFRTRCTRVQSIRINAPGKEFGVWIDEERISMDECQMLAQHDGFEDFGEMMLFWNGRLPFEGVIVHWAFPAEGPQ